MRREGHMRENRANKPAKVRLLLKEGGNWGDKRDGGKIVGPERKKG